MKVSTKGRYGLIAMVDLAMNVNCGCISLKSIAERQDISEKYLEQIFSLLKKSGLVKSVKGMQGGYTLEKEGSQITVANVLEALEGNLAFSTLEEEKNLKATIANSIETEVWKKIDQSIEEMLNSITLEDLVKHYKNRLAQEDVMYFI